MVATNGRLNFLQGRILASVLNYTFFRNPVKGLLLRYVDFRGVVLKGYRNGGSLGEGGHELV